jgi:hypothetical protein
MRRVELLVVTIAQALALGLAGCGEGTPPSGGHGGSAGEEAEAGSGGGGGAEAAGGSGGTKVTPDAAAGGGTIGADASAAGPPDASAPAADTTPMTTGPDVTAGTTKLFDGTTLTGWEQGMPVLFSVKDGTLDGNGTTNGALLITKDDYADFRIIVSSRMVANNGKGHLGICFWGAHAPAGKYNACKLLIPPGGGSWDYGGGGGLPGITKTPGVTAKFNSMEWHQTEIVCKQATGTCRMATDGVDQLTYKDPNPGRLKKGPIGLQIHAGTSEVQYKDVYVDAAPADDNLHTVKGK